MVAAECRLLLYRRSGNLGDMIQTAAMSRLVPQAIGIYRDRVGEPWHRELPFIVNGYLGEAAAPDDPNCLFAGVFLPSRNKAVFDRHVEAMKASRYPVGTRDPFTSVLLLRAGVDASYLGCASLTLPAYDGPRRGVLSVDFPGPGRRLTQAICADMTFDDQWELALRRLDELRTASVVYTSRLHVALPCLAMGTPVVLAKPEFGKTFEPERLASFDALALPFDHVVTYDTEPARRRFRAHLQQQLGWTVHETDPKKPLDQP